MIPYEPAAKSGAPCPDDITGMDRGLYKCIQWLVKRYRAGEINADESKTEMQAIRDTYDQLQDLYRQWKACRDFEVDIYAAMTAYAKDRNAEAAERLYRVVASLVRMSDEERRAVLGDG